MKVNIVYVYFILQFLVPYPIDEMPIIPYNGTD